MHHLILCICASVSVCTCVDFEILLRRILTREIIVIKIYFSYDIEIIKKLNLDHFVLPILHVLFYFLYFRFKFPLNFQFKKLPNYLKAIKGEINPETL